jgi:predicted phosphodiesterase
LSKHKIFERLPSGWTLHFPIGVDSKVLRTLNPELLFFAVPDLHGNAPVARATIELLEGLKAKQVVFLGDLIDKGNQSRIVVDRVVAALKRNPRWKLIAGNHEALFVENFLAGTRTLESDAFYSQLDQIDRKHYASIFDDLPIYYEAQQVIFVHGGVSASYRARNIAQVPAYELLWTYEVSPRYAGKKLCRGHCEVATPTEAQNHISLETCGWWEGRPFTVGIVADVKMPRQLLGWLELAPLMDAAR